MPPRDPLDFKIKTLEELRAEKGKPSSSSDPKPRPEPLPTIRATISQDRPHPKPHPVPHPKGEAPRRKKVVLVRRKMSQDVQPRPTTTVSEPTSPSKLQPHSIPADPASIPERFGSSVRPQTSVSLGKRRTCDSDSELETKSKHKKLSGHVTMLRHKEQDMEFAECTRDDDDDDDDDIMDAAGSGRGQERKLSIAELRTEM